MHFPLEHLAMISQDFLFKGGELVSFTLLHHEADDPQDSHNQSAGPHTDRRDAC